MYDDLRFIMGFEKMILRNNRLCKNIPRLKYELESLFIYMDIMEYMSVGNVQVRLLRKIPSYSGLEGLLTNYEPRNKNNIRLGKKNIYDIKIEIRTSTCELFHLSRM